MSAVFPRSDALIFQAQEGFVHEGGALEGVLRPFRPEINLGQAQELVVDGRDHLVQGLDRTSRRRG